MLRMEEFRMRYTMWSLTSTRLCRRLAAWPKSYPLQPKPINALALLDHSPGSLR